MRSNIERTAARSGDPGVGTATPDEDRRVGRGEGGGIGAPMAIIATGEPPRRERMRSARLVDRPEQSFRRQCSARGAERFLDRLATDSLRREAPRDDERGAERAASVLKMRQ